MSFEKSTIINRCKNFNPVICEHVCKCVIYGHLGDIIYNKYDHWIHEIATLISKANGLTSKNNKKLSAHDYAEYLFGDLGTEYNDAAANVYSQYWHDRRSDNPYPEVVIDRDTEAKMYDASQSIIASFGNVLSHKNNLVTADIEDMLHQILDPICLK